MEFLQRLVVNGDAEEADLLVAVPVVAVEERACCSSCELPADDDDSNDDAPTPRVAFDGKVELAFTFDAPFIPWCELQSDDLCNRVNGIGADDPEQCYDGVGFGSVPMDCALFRRASRAAWLLEHSLEG